MEDDIKAVNEKMDTLIKLVACGLAIGKTQQESIAIFSKSGLQPKVIAELLGTTPNTVRVTLTSLRKRRKK